MSYADWPDRRLRQTRAYLRHCIRDGRRDVYDAEEYRLKLLPIEEEIARRPSPAPVRFCPCSLDSPVPAQPGYRYCPDCLSIARSNPEYREEDYRD